MTKDKKELGRLRPVPLREVWDSESGSFTPWLAEASNLALVGDTIDLDLELETREKNVGPFRADIVCRDQASDSLVLIENQLERTDHTHLGQLMTYAAGLDAVTVVWIAERFTEEHRAALDWLNEITLAKVNFFGLEVELWRIGASPIAPKFNVVARPNEWTKGGRNTEWTDTMKTRFEYWKTLSDEMTARKATLRSQKPLAQAWTNFAIGRTGLFLVAWVNGQKRRIGAHLAIQGPWAKQHFAALHADKAAIEAEAGRSFVWRENPGKKESQVRVERPNTDPDDRESWPEQHQWLFENLEALRRVFSHRVKQLPSSYAQGNDQVEGE